jgi:hypothetical protein
MWRMGMRDSSKCADCGCDLLAVAKDNPVPAFVAALQFVRRMTGKNVFICWRCAAERYKARQKKGSEVTCPRLTTVAYADQYIHTASGRST